MDEEDTCEESKAMQAAGEDVEDKRSEDEEEGRGNWTGRLDFIFSCLSYAVGLGNVWRFPYLCYRNGGGAFLLPFFIMLFLIGIPLFFLETAFGQFASSGVISIWKVSPIFTGIGGGMFLVSFLVSVYYNVIIAWAFYYLFASFSADLPWSTCGNSWNTPACRVQGSAARQLSCEAVNGSLLNGTCLLANGSAAWDDGYRVATGVTNVTAVQYRTPSDEYFHNHVLNISDGFHDMGLPSWRLALCLLLAWSLVCVCMIRGIKSSGRAVYFTATFPYLVLLVLLVRGITLPGAVNGIIYYVTPKWEKLLEAKVWGDAAVQIFFSLAPGWGGLITLSSYNKFNNNCLRDTYIVAVGDCLTSFGAGFVIFTIIGYMAHEMNVGIDKVATEGAGLAFIVYPDVVTRLPASPLWAVLFFLMLITLGLGTQFAIVNTVHTTIIDMFPDVFHKGHRRSVLMVAICGVCFLLGLVCVTRGGMFALQLMDSYSATYAVLVIAFTECLALTWVYGYDQLAADIKLMLGFQIGRYWYITWKFISPLTMLGLFVFMCAQFKSTSYASYSFPWYADGIGWCLALVTILCIPGVALYKVCTAAPHLSLIQRLRALSRPTSDWGPVQYRGVVKARQLGAPGNADSLALDNAAIPLNSRPATVECDTSVL